MDGLKKRPAGYNLIAARVRFMIPLLFASPKQHKRKGEKLFSQLDFTDS